MLLTIHIIIALISVLFSSLILFNASKSAIRGSYTLAAGTFSTGIALAIHNPALILHVCASGVLYLAITSVLTLMAHKKLRAATALARTN